MSPSSESRSFSSALVIVIVTSLLRSATGSDILEYYVLEELPPYRIVGDIRSDFNFDERFDRSVFGLLRFAVLTHPPANRRYLAVNETTGLIQTTHRIDREKICAGAEECIIKFDVVVRPQQYFQIIKVMVYIVDENDNSPTFPDLNFVQQVSESAEVGSGFTIPAATDPDSPRYGVTRYELSPPDGKFRLNVRRSSPAAGDFDLRLVLVDKLDRETQDRYKMTIYAFDGGEPHRTGSIHVDITVIDANDNSPVFDRESYEVRVSETAPVGTVLVTVRATDRDTGLNGAIRYEFSKHTAHDHGTSFSIRPENGKIVLQRSLDFESVQMHILSVTATDRGPDALPAHVNVVIRVDDVNDNAPRIQVNALHSGNRNNEVNRYINNKLSVNTDGTFVATVDENSPPGTFIAHMLVTDADRTHANSRFRCAIDDNVNFRLQEMYSPSSSIKTNQTVAVTSTASAVSTSSAEFKLLTGNVTFDRERRDSYRIAVTCRDFGGGSDVWIAPGGIGGSSLTSSVVIRVIVGDVNDNPPVFRDDVPAVLVRVTENGPIGEELVRLHAADIDIGQNSEIKYHLDVGDDKRSLQTLISVDESTGIVRTLAPLDREVMSAVEFDVVAVDGGRPRLSASVRVKVIVLDLDDERPIFVEPFYSFSITENMPAGTNIGQVTAVDKDESPFNQFIYSLDPEVTDLFAINRSTGYLTTMTSLDREHHELYQFFVWARSERNADRMSSAAVTVKVEDVDDNRPRFVSTLNETISVSSFTPPGYRVARLVAVDPDAPIHADLIYSVLKSLESDAGEVEQPSPLPSRSSLFEVDSRTGDVRVSEAGLIDVDYDEVRLVVEVREMAEKKLPAADTAELRLVVSRDIPFTMPLDQEQDQEQDQTEGRRMRGVSDPFGLRLDDEKMVVVLAVTLAVVLVAITIVVVVFACIRSTDRRRTCVTSSSAAILSNVMSLQGSENKQPLPITTPVAPRYGLNRNRDVGDVLADIRRGPPSSASPLYVNGNGNAKLNGTMTVTASGASVNDNGNMLVRSTGNDDGWKQRNVVQPTGAGQQQATSGVLNESSASQMATQQQQQQQQPSEISTKPVVVFIKDTSLGDIASRTVDSESEDGGDEGDGDGGTTGCTRSDSHRHACTGPREAANSYTKTNILNASCQPCSTFYDPVFVLPPVSASDSCRSSFSQAQLQLLQSCSSTMPSRPRRISRDLTGHVTADDVQDQPLFGVKFPRGIYGGCKVADMRYPSRRGMGHGPGHGLPVGLARVQLPRPAHSLSYSDLQLSDRDYAIIRPTLATVSHGGASSFTRYQQQRDTGTKQYVVLDTRMTDNSRLPPYEI